MPSNPAAGVRQFIEDAQVRHYQYPPLAEALGRAELNSCITCSQKWPCDAIRLIDKLEQVVTALEWYADPENYHCFDGWTGSPADNDAGKRARDVLRRIAGIE